MSYQTFYQTKNIKYAALLYSMHQDLDSTHIESGQMVYVFVNSVKCEKVIKDFLQHRVFVDAKSLFDAIETIENMINRHSSVYYVQTV